MAAFVPESWSEQCKISICREGIALTNEVQFQALTETVDIDIGDKDFEAIATTSGGRIIKYTPQEVTSITLEAYPLEAGTVGGTTGTGFFDLVNTYEDETQPLSISVDHNRTRYRMTVLWTNDTANTGAQKEVLPDYLGLRVAACGFFISAKPSFTDGVLKFSVVMKCPPFTKSGSANVNIGSCDATVTLQDLGKFSTTSNGFISPTSPT